MINSISPNQSAKASIFYLNDLHGEADSMGGLMYAADKFDKRAKDNKADEIKIHAGDCVSGADDQLAQLITKFFGKGGVNFDVITLGNHEFDFKTPKMAAFLSKMDPKIIATNLDVSDSSPLKPLVQKSYVKAINGSKYGFIGLQPFELATVSANDIKAQGIEVKSFENTVKSTQEEINKLKAEGINKIIIISHIGASNDRKLAPLIDGADVIVGGHSHTLTEGLKSGDNFVYSKSKEPIAIVQAGRDGKNYGVLDVEFSDKGIIKKIDNATYKTPETTSIYIEKLKSHFLPPSPKVGEIAHIDPIIKNRLTEENAYASFVCDVTRKMLNVDIAFINSANIRKLPVKGELNERTIHKATPFKNDMIITTISEKGIVKGLNFAAKSLHSPDNVPGIIQVGGLRYKVDKNDNVTNVWFVKKDGQLEELNVKNPSESKIYTCAYDTFLANGKEYPPFKRNESQITKHFDFDKDKLVLDYLKINGSKPLELRKDGRISIEGEAKTEQTSQRQQQNNNMQSPLGNIFLKSA